MYQYIVYQQNLSFLISMKNHSIYSNYLQDTSKCSCTYETDLTKGRNRQMTKSFLLMETCTKKMACGLALTALFNSTATHFYGNRCMGLYIYIQNYSVKFSKFLPFPTLDPQIHIPAKCL